MTFPWTGPQKAKDIVSVFGPGRPLAFDKINIGLPFREDLRTGIPFAELNLLETG